MYFSLLFHFTREKIYEPVPGPSKVFAKQGCCGFESEKCQEFFWQNSQQIFHGIIPKEIFRFWDQNALYQKIMALKPSSKAIFLTIPDQAFSSKMAMVQIQEDGLFLYLDTDELKKQKPVKLNFVQSSEEKSCSKEALDSLMKTCWQNKADFSDASCYIGSEGILVYKDEYFWVACANNLMNGQEELHKAEWKKFVDWPLESKRFLPKELSTAEARKEIPREKLAEYIVSPFSEARKKGWEVSPMGLFVGLAEDKSNMAEDKSNMAEDKSNMAEDKSNMAEK
jgi:hypothetical protein